MSGLKQNSFQKQDLAYPALGKTNSCSVLKRMKDIVLGFPQNRAMCTKDFTVVRIDQSSVCVIDFELQVDMQESETNKGMEEMDVYHTSKKEEKPRTKIVVCLPIFCGRVVYGLLFF